MQGKITVDHIGFIGLILNRFFLKKSFTLPHSDAKWHFLLFNKINLIFAKFSQKPLWTFKSNSIGPIWTPHIREFWRCMLWWSCENYSSFQFKVSPKQKLGLNLINGHISTRTAKVPLSLDVSHCLPLGGLQNTT